MERFNEIIGIDISKLKFDVRVHSTQLSAVFQNDTKGFNALIKWLKKSVSVGSTTLFAFEHTGIYSMPISIFLSDHQYIFVVLPGLEIKRSLGIQRGKDDTIDAKRIAEYVYQRRDKIMPSKLPFKNILKIRRLLAIRDRLVRQRSSFLKDKKENKMFLKQDENKVLFQVVEQTIKSQTKLIMKIESEIDNIVKEDNLIYNQLKLITSIKGVGIQTALLMITYTNGFTRFKTWRQFASYAGTAPFPYASGSSIKGRNKVSHLANKKLKVNLNLCARSAILSNTELKLYYKQRMEKGGNGMSSLNIIRNKLIAKIFAVIDRGTPYVDTCKFVA